VDPGGGQGADVVLGTEQVGLHGCTEPVGHSLSGDSEPAAQDRVGVDGALRTDLNTSTGRQRFSDPRQAVSGAVRVGVDRQMGQVQRQPHVRWWVRKRGGQGQVVLSDPIGRRPVPNEFAEQVDAHSVTLRQQVAGGGQRFVPGTPGDVA